MAQIQPKATLTALGQTWPVRLFCRNLGVLLASSCVCFLMAASLSDNARAAEAKVRTLLLAAVPEATTIEIRLPVEEGSDDLRLAIILADHFSVLLRDLGYRTVEANGELVFRFVAEERTYARRRGNSQQASLVDERAWGYPHGSRFHPTQSVKLINLSDSDRDIYRLRVSVARTRKPPLWTGYIERSVKGAERQSTYLGMADRLLALWGRTYSGSD